MKEDSNSADACKQAVSLAVTAFSDFSTKCRTSALLHIFFPLYLFSVFVFSLFRWLFSLVLRFSERLQTPRCSSPPELFHFGAHSLWRPSVVHTLYHTTSGFSYGELPEVWSLQSSPVSDSSLEKRICCVCRQLGLMWFQKLEIPCGELRCLSACSLTYWPFGLPCSFWSFRNVYYNAYQSSIFERFIYFNCRQRIRESDLFHSSNDCNSGGWSRLKPLTWNPIWVSMGMAGAWAVGQSSATFLRTFSRELEQK